MRLNKPRRAGRVLALVFMFAPALFLAAQDGPRSPAGLDRETEKTAALVYAFLGGVSGGSITAGDAGSPLGRYWVEHILTLITGKPGVSVVERDGADYRLGVSIVELGNTVRMYTKVLRIRDAGIAAVWTADMVKTPFLESLLAFEDASRVRPDFYEDDSREKPVLLEAGRELSRTLHKDDTDWFIFTPLKSGYAVVETSGSVDTEIVVYSGKGLLVQNDDGGDAANARAGFIAAAGTPYTILVRGYSGNDTGAYTVRADFSEIPGKNLEPNDTIETALYLALNNDSTDSTASIDSGESINTVNAFIATIDDEDWYKIEIPPGGGYFSVRTESETDTYLELFDGRGKKLAGNDDWGNGINAKIALVLDAGVYYVKVRAYESGAYTLSYSLHEVNRADAWEPDDTRETAKTIAINEVQIRTFTTEDDVDWARFTVDTGGFYIIRAQGRENPELDTYISLYDANGELLGEDDDSGKDFDAMIGRKLAPGQYYIRVEVLEYPAGSYSLSVTREVSVP